MLKKNSFKVSCKKEQITIKTKLGKNEEINEKDMEIFQRKLVRGLMRPVESGKKKLTYTAPVGISLRKYLKRGISKQDFFRTFVQILEITVKAETNGFNINNLVLSLDHVFINETTKEVHMIYQPIFTQNVATGIFPFLYDVIHTSVFQINEDMHVVNELMGYMGQMQHFSAERIENYIEKIYPEIFKIIARYNPGDSQNLREKQWDTEHGVKRAGFDGNDDTDLLNEEGTDLLDEQGTDVLDTGGEPETEMLNENTVSYPYLIRLKNYERIDVKKSEFWIGKQLSKVNYCVTDNPAVSRQHAVIKSRGQNYFIQDNYSTNKTCVNYTELKSGQEIAISDGDTIRLADEDFEFHRE